MVKLSAQVKSILRNAKKCKISKSEAARSLQISRKTLYTLLKGRKIRKTRKELVSKQILGIVVANPEYGPRKISETLKTNGISLSSRSVWQELKVLNLGTVKLRINYSFNFAKPKTAKDNGLPIYLKLSPDARKMMVENEDPVSFKTSRKTYSKWKKRYQNAFDNGISIMESLSDAYLKGSYHPKGISDKLETEILSLVVINPEYSSHKIAQKMGTVGNHGVQRVLERNNLSHYEMRRAYAAARATIPTFVKPSGIFGRIRSVFESFVPNLAPAPPPGTTSLLRTFASSLFLTLFISLTYVWWISIIINTSGFAASIGMVLATIALGLGMFFFLYSLKYYFTLAIVLSHSQNEELDGLKSNLEDLKLKNKPPVSVHIALYNEKNVVERLTHAVTSLDYPNYEVIFADDSTDATTQQIRTYMEKLLFKGERLKVIAGEDYTLTEVEVKPGVVLKHLHRTSRSGFKGGALALALRVSDPRAEYVTVFDADFVPYPDTLTLFLKYFQSSAQSLMPNASNVAAVQGYQWHVLNKSENWITRGVRSEYSGSYVVERAGTEIYGGLKQISGSVYMIKRKILGEIGWGTSITEDFELTLKLYEKGYKVVYTPYIQAPAECVSTLKRLIRQRMRWAEGHSFNIKKMFIKLLKSPKLTFAEKFELTYLSPYYLQALFFLIGTLSWLISETIFKVRLPFWTELWGWSLVLTNMISLPLLNSVGLFLEESEERDYMGIGSFVLLSYIVVPFQAFAAVKGFLEKEEGPWFRTPKTGKITDIFTRSRFYKFTQGFIPGKAPALEEKYLALTTANNRFDGFNIRKQKNSGWLGKLVLVVLLVISTTLFGLAPNISQNNIPIAWAADIFNITHDGGDLSEYTSSVTDSGDLSVTAAAALGGTTNGLNVLIDDTTSIYGNKDGTKTTQSRFRFYIDPNSLTMANGDAFGVASLRQNGAGSAFIAVVDLAYYTATGYRLNFIGTTDTGGPPPDGYADNKNISDAPHYVEVLAVSATNSTSANGTYQWWVDGTSEGSVTGKDNYNRFNDYNHRYQLGVIYGIDAGTSGTFYMDEFKANDDGGVIGEVPENLWIFLFIIPFIPAWFNRKKKIV